MSAAQEVRWRMHQKVTSAAGGAIYAHRKVIVEPVFGQIKAALGFDRFSLRGLGKVARKRTARSLLCKPKGLPGAVGPSPNP